ncbi:Cytochrome c oxidase polypeptide I+III [Planctomycetes bacterium Pan216]|uniref:Cytochrome c oxidase polypeptide I+III n=1 Tax=Kolteria novifilia TaxID=2527975 RepID=A0A518BA70_9BACT|nr:Cytochrome c oxidase polypeptide I+III [Planctomycetes bacterium Pan216]
MNHAAALSAHAESPHHDQHALGGWTPLKVGMASFLFSEAALFATLIVAYLKFLGQDDGGPTPEVLNVGRELVAVILLLVSSITVQFASRDLARGRCTSCTVGVILTFILTVGFLIVTGLEWRELIAVDGLTINRNLFGSSFYTLFGFHLGHVLAGCVMLLIMMGIAFSGSLNARSSPGMEAIAWYWHFVNGVSVTLFLVVYVITR